MQLELIALYLNEYFMSDDDDWVFPADKTFIKSGIKILIEERGMTVDGIRREALDRYSVIIPWEFFEGV